jgi:hypothetical protein
MKKIFSMTDFCTCEQFKKINELFEWAENFDIEEELAKIKHLEPKPEPKAEPEPEPEPEQEQKLKINYVGKQICLKNFDNDETKNDYFYIAKDRTADGHKIYSEIHKNKINNFINDYLTTNNNLYEIIRPYTKIKLFFDLEQKQNKISINWEDDAQQKLQIFIQFLKLQVKEILKVDLTNNDIIILDSSDQLKTSYHLIINKIIFENIETQKIFIKYIENTIYSNNFYNNLIGDFIDSGIYTKNRPFRFINQSKLKQTRILKNNNVEILKTFVTAHEDQRNYIKMNDIQHLEKNKFETVKTTKTKQTNNIKKHNINIYSSHFASIQKVNLKTLKNMTDEDIKEMKPYKQYLYLLHQPLKWEVYNNVVCAVASVEGSTVEDVKEWAALHPEYNENDDVIKTFDKKKEWAKQNIKHKNLYYLRQIAKLCDPDFFKDAPEELIKNLFGLNLEGYDVIIEDSKYIDEKRDLLLLVIKFILIYAPMGKGKTQFIKDYIKLHPDKSILYLSCRQSFANFITGEDFKEIGLVNYLDFKENKQEITKHKKICCSLESLRDLEFIDKFDIIILDEVETVLNIFSSPTMKGNTTYNYNLLKSYIDKSERVFAADAFITNRTIDFINNFQGDKTIIINEKPNIERIAIEVHENIILNVLCDSIKKGEKNYICFGSAKKLNLFYDTIIKNKLLEKEEILYYMSSSDDNETKRTLNNINNEWVKYKLVMTTPTITIGCSFSVPDYFDNTFIISYPSCVVRDIFQMHMRARTIKKNKIYFSIPETKTYNFIKSNANIKMNIYNNYDETINNNYELQKKLIAEYRIKLNKQTTNKYIINEIEKLKNYEYYFITKSTETPEDLKQILKYNLFEEAFSAQYYKYMFYYFLKRCNYKIIDTSINIDDIEIIEIYKDNDKYNEDYIINEYDSKIIEENIKKKQATENEKLKLDRYYFNKFLGSPELEQEIFNKLYVDLWQDKFKRSNITHTKNEILKNLGLKTFDDEHIKKNVKFNKSDIDNKIFRLKYIEEVKEILNINYSFDNVKITRDKINNCTKYFTENRQDIYNIFGIPKDKQGKADLDFKKTLEFINMMFNNWNGSQIKGDVKTKDRKGVYNSYEIFNKQIEELKTDFNFNILDIFKQKEEDEEYEEINYINYCFDNLDETNEKIDNIEYMGRNIIL